MDFNAHPRDQCTPAVADKGFSLTTQWLVASPYIHVPDTPWLMPFVPRTGKRDPQFAVVPATYRHDRSRSITGAGGWGDYFNHGLTAWRQASQRNEPAGIITCFPQLAAVVGLRNALSRRPVPTIAWVFNLGHMPDGLKRKVAMRAFREISLFAVHSTPEIKAYSDWLEMPRERFRYVPLQRPAAQRFEGLSVGEPYAIALGSAKRDYASVLLALGRLKMRAIVVAAPHALAGLNVPPNVEVKSGLTAEACLQLLQGARVHVLALANRTTASGQVTLLDAMAYGIASVVTACPGTVDYATDDEDALVVEAGDPDALTHAIQRLWEDDTLRQRLGNRALQRQLQEHSDQMAGRHLRNAIDAVSRSTPGFGGADTLVPDSAFQP